MKWGWVRILSCRELYTPLPGYVLGAELLFGAQQAGGHGAHQAVVLVQVVLHRRPCGGRTFVHRAFVQLKC